MVKKSDNSSSKVVGVVVVVVVIVVVLIIYFATRKKKTILSTTTTPSSTKTSSSSDTIEKAVEWITTTLEPLTTTIMPTTTIIPTTTISPIYTTNLVFWLKGGYSNVPTTDDTGSYTVTNSGSVTMYNDPTKGYVFYLNGSSYLRIPLQTTTNATRTFWVSTSTPTSNSGNTMSSNSWPCWFNGTSNLHTAARFNSSSTIKTTYTQTSTWVFYAVTVSSTTFSIYVNGELNVSGTTSNWSGDTENLYIGSFTGVSNLTGYMTDLRQYNTTLTADQILYIYNGH